MKWYFAARMRHQSMLCDVAEKLQQQKEEILSSWLWRDSLKPYADHKEAAAAAAAQEVQEICDSNIFVLMSDQEGTDMFVELGVAFAVQ